MAKAFNQEAAEREANEIAFQFQNSTDVIGDMSRAHHTDFSGIRIHTDEAADRRVQEAGKDALAVGRDIFFGKGIFESQEPASKGLVAHELAHTMQQGMAGGEAQQAVSEQAPTGTEQGGVLDWFRSIFKKKPKTEHLGSTKATDEASLAYMAAMKAREQEIFDEKRASALEGVTINANEQVLSSELLAENQRASAAAIPESNRLWSDSGLDYAENFLNGVQDAKVFQDGAISPLSYLLTTILTGEGANLTRVMVSNGYNQMETGLAKDQLGKDVRKSMMVPAAMDMVNEEERKALPPQVQSLYAKYQEIQRQLTEALEARRANR